MIETRRLRLLPATLESLRAELASPAELARIIRLDVSPEWPPELYDRDPIEYTLRQLQAAPGDAAWWLYYFVRKPDAVTPAVLIGCGGYKGPPRDGTVEIGYSIVPEYRRQGYASEAADGFVRHAFRLHEVQRVIAHTLPGLVSSIGVLERCGFRYDGAGPEAGVVRYGLERAAWERRHTRHAQAQVGLGL